MMAAGRSFFIGFSGFSENDVMMPSKMRCSGKQEERQCNVDP